MYLRVESTCLELHIDVLQYMEERSWALSLD